MHPDHIGRSVFAANASGVKTWTASYLPFGGVRVTTGTPPTARFPGQWFQLGEPDQTSLRGSDVTANGLHQNWMRDYDPATGRYIQADPLGLVDGASVYGYARQSPGRFVDPRGEETVSLRGFGRSPGNNWTIDESYQHEDGIRYKHICSPATLEFHFEDLEASGGHWHYYPNGNWSGGGRDAPLSRLWDLLTKNHHLPVGTTIDVPDCFCEDPTLGPILPELPPLG
jgi:RHS repeat-associated protein